MVARVRRSASRADRGRVVRAAVRHARQDADIAVSDDTFVGNCAAGATLDGGNAPAGRFYGCEDVDYAPTDPLTVRLMATLYLD